MALANFFDKAALSASQVLAGFDRQQFEKILLSQHIAIIFDSTATESIEGQLTLDMLTRLLCRLYPVVTIRNLDNDSLVKRLTNLARSINPVIEMDVITPITHAVVVGLSSFSDTTHVFYTGSDNWNLKISSSAPVGCGDSSNPIGAGGAACFAAANVFREVFAEQLPYSKPDDDLFFSMLNLNIDPKDNGPHIPEIDLKELALVGLGAIGNAVVWVLNSAHQIGGSVIGIDSETVALSNLQRYIMTTQDDVDKSKAAITERLFKRQKIKFEPASTTWQDWLDFRKDWNLERVAVCVDNKHDRIMVQGALPRKLFNAWTQLENLGVSRHVDFLSKPCLGCIYPPEQRKSKSVLIAEALNMLPYEQSEIRPRLAIGSPIDDHLSGLIAVCMQIDQSVVSGYVGQSLEIFYSEVVCGGVALKLNPLSSPVRDQSMNVPTVFESAFAGILLASEIIIDAMGLTELRPTTISTFNLIREVKPTINWINRNESKRPGCFCSDKTFQEAYKVKYNS